MRQKAVLIAGTIMFTFTLSVCGSQQPSDANNLVRLGDYLTYAPLNWRC